MNRILLTALLSIVPLPFATAGLKETKAQIEARYGEPFKIAGYPRDRRYTYRFERYEVDVTYRNDISIAESYRAIDKDAQLNADEVERFLGLNSTGMIWQKRTEDSWILAASPSDPAERAVAFNHGFLLLIGELLPSAASPPLDPDYRTGEQREITGIATIKKWERGEMLVIRNQDEVVEIGCGTDRLGQISNDKTYTVLMLDGHPNVEDPIAFVSDREHNSLEDALDDSRFYQLLQVKEGDAVVFDQSVCELP